MMIDLLPRLQDALLFSDDVTIPLASSKSEGLYLRLVEVVIHSCPAHFCIAMAANGRDDPAWMRVWHVAGGRALERLDARKAAVLEALERACLIHGGADDPRTRTIAFGQNRPYSAAELAHYSTDQVPIDAAIKQESATSGCGLAVDNLWMSGHSLTRGDAVDVAAAAVLFPDVERKDLPLASSTGAAIRDTHASATRHALYELVERDAVAAWWYNRIVPHRLPSAASVDALPATLAAWLGERSRFVWHLVLDTDLPAAVVVAVSCEADGTRPALGASAAPTVAAAVRASTLELLQVEASLGQMRIAAEAGVIEPPPLLAWSEATDALATAMLHGTAARPPAGPAPDDEAALLRALSAAEIDVVAVDLTRPEIGIPVVRVVSPHLRDWGPRFAPGRLYDLPVRLGLRDRPLAEAELNAPFVL